MKLPEIPIRAAEQLGKNDLGATGSLARSKGNLANAQAGMLNDIATVAGDYKRRQEKAEFDQGRSEFTVEAQDWKAEHDAKEFYSADELRAYGVPEDVVSLSYESSDTGGNKIDVPVQRVPAYKVRPFLYQKKLTSLMESKASQMSSAQDRSAFTNQARQYVSQQHMLAAVDSSKKQLKYQNSVYKSQALNGAERGNSDILVENVNAMEVSEQEKSVVLKEGLTTIETNEYQRAIDKRDVDAMNNFLNYLASDNYSGQLLEDGEKRGKEIANLRSGLSSAMTASSARNSRYRAELSQKLDDTKTALEDGLPVPFEDVQALRSQGSELKLDSKVIDLERAYKKSAFITEMYKVPAEGHQELIDKYIDNAAGSSAERNALRSELMAKSVQVAKAIANDPAGTYLGRSIGEMPDMNDPDYLSKLVVKGKEAGITYNVNVRGSIAKILPERIAEQFARDMDNKTGLEKAKFINSVMKQVPDKSDRDAIFRQMDAKGAGSMNVYADLIDRGLPGVIKDLDEGRELRKETSLKLLPKDLASRLDMRLSTIYATPTERKTAAEATMDIYAKLARDEGLYAKQSTDTDLLDTAVMLAAGNVVNYEGRQLMLPDNQLTADSFDDWVTGLKPEYIESQGGVRNMEPGVVAKGISDGDIQMRPTGVRGQYFLTDATGMYLRNNETDQHFIFKYDANAPRKIVQSRSQRRVQGRK